VICTSSTPQIISIFHQDIYENDKKEDTMTLKLEIVIDVVVISLRTTGISRNGGN